MGITLYTHRCPECGLTYRVALNRTRHSLLRTRCPDCKSRSFFDNSDGALEYLPRKRRLSFAIRQYDLVEGRDYERQRDEPPARSVEEAVQRHALKTRRMFGGQRTEDGYLLVGLAGSASPPPAEKPGPPVRPRTAPATPPGKAPTQPAAKPAARAPEPNGPGGLNGQRSQTPAQAVPAAVTPPGPGRPAPVGAELTKQPALPENPRAAAMAPPVPDASSNRLAEVATIPDDSDIPVVQATQVFWHNPDIDREPGESGGAFAWRVLKETCIALLRLPGEFVEAFRELLRLPADLREGRRSRRETYLVAGLYAFVLSQVALLCVFLVFQFPSLIFFHSPDDFLPRLLPVQSNRILDRDGKLIAELFSRKTSNLSLESFPPTLREKLIFVEDQDFFDHTGVRWTSILRATLRNIRALDYVEGGSTLTQQLARIVLRNRDRTLLRKFREAVMAAYFERKLSKDEILTAYINHVYMGHGAYGMEVASEFYFNRPLGDLNFVEELMLVALLPAPEKFSPLHNPQLLSRRLDILYDRMIGEGFTAVTPAIYHGQKRKLFEKFNRSPNENVFAVRFNEAPYVAEYVRLLIKNVLGEEWQYDSSLTIHTTIDSRLQQSAVQETVAYINEIGPGFPPARTAPAGEDQDRMQKILSQEYRMASVGGFLMGLPVHTSRPPRLQVAAIGLKPGTGEILFLQGGSEFSPGNQLNRAIDMRRQTGSAIKPIVYSAGIERGLITPATVIKDAPLQVGSWEPKNFNDTYSGSVSVREALMRSLNVPSVRIGMQVGMKGLSDQFQKFFFSDEDLFKKRFRSDYTIAIGSLEMSPLEMAVAYSAFGNNGMIMRPFLVREIKDPTGRVLYSHKLKDEFNLRIPPAHRAIPGDVAQVVASLLEDSAKNGGVARGGFTGGPLLGKTGTSNDSRDAWFIGIVPNMVAAIWVGYDESVYVMPGATGSGVAGPLWGRIVSKGMDVKGEFQFSPRAREVPICSATGRLARPACPNTYTELFSGSIPPRLFCWKHGVARAESRESREKTRIRKTAPESPKAAPAPVEQPPAAPIPAPPPTPAPQSVSRQPAQASIQAKMP